MCKNLKCITDSNILVSIIVPVYNVEDNIERCIKSIINQSLSNIEIIIINDGSTDCSKNIIQRLSRLDTRIKFIDKKNTGVSDTRNIGIEKSRGKYIIFIDSDDYIDKYMVEKLYNDVENNKLDMSICKYVCINKNFKKDEIWPINFQKNNIKKEFISMIIGPKNEREFNQERWIMGSASRCIYSRFILIKHNIRFNCNLSYAEDLIFNLNYLSVINNVGMIDESLYFYDITEDSLSKKYRSDLLESCKLMIDNIKLINEKNSIIDNFESRIAFLYFRYSITCIRNIMNDLSKLQLKDYIYIKKILNNEELHKSLELIDMRKLNKKYKLFYIIFKYKLNIIVVINLYLNKIKSRRKFKNN